MEPYTAMILGKKETVTGWTAAGDLLLAEGRCYTCEPNPDWQAANFRSRRLLGVCLLELRGGAWRFSGSALTLGEWIDAETARAEAERNEKRAAAGLVPVSWATSPVDLSPADWRQGKEAPDQNAPERRSCLHPDFWRIVDLRRLLAVKQNERLGSNDVVAAAWFEGEDDCGNKATPVLLRSFHPKLPDPEAVRHGEGLARMERKLDAHETGSVTRHGENLCQHQQTQKVACATHGMVAEQHARSQRSSKAASARRGKLSSKYQDREKRIAEMCRHARKFLQKERGPDGKERIKRGNLDFLCETARTWWRRHKAHKGTDEEHWLDKQLPTNKSSTLRRWIQRDWRK